MNDTSPLVIIFVCVTVQLISTGIFCYKWYKKYKETSDLDSLYNFYNNRTLLKKKSRSPREAASVLKSFGMKVYPPSDRDPNWAVYFHGQGGEAPLSLNNNEVVQFSEKIEKYGKGPYK